MKKKFSISAMVIIFGLVAIILLIVSGVQKNREYHEKRKELAKTMGVSLDDYPNLPDDYLPEVIVEGKSLEEVHEIVVGYEKVFHRSADDGLEHNEIYYFFSSDDDKANRILIGYDEKYLVDLFRQEDKNSRTLTTGGWPEGLLTK